MKTIYLIILIISASALTADCILRYTAKIKNFGFEKRLFKIKGKTIPIEEFFPQSLTVLFLSAMVFSIFGLLFDFLGLDWYFSLPCAVSGGLIVCFCVQFAGKNALDYFFKNNLPKGETAANLDGYCVETIESGDWGKVILFHKDREYLVNAVCAKEESEIEEGIKVICVYEQDGFYFVARVDEIYQDIDI